MNTEILEVLKNIELSLDKSVGEGQSVKLRDKYLKDLDNEYFFEYPADTICDDIQIMEKINPDNLYAISISTNGESNKLYAISISTNGELNKLWQIKLFRYNEAVSLSRGLPLIENFGFKLLEEHPYRIKLKNDVTIFVCDFKVELPPEIDCDINNSQLRINLEAAIVAAFNRDIENDSLNKLVLYAGLEAREVVVLRAVAQYLIQTTIPFSKIYMAECLGAYPDIAHKLYQLFSFKFDPKACDVNQAKAIYNQITEDLKQVKALDEDQILKAFLAVIDAMLRTNYYQLNQDGLAKSYISFKIESAKLAFLPLPRPLYEIFVHSIRFEAIHLRGGKVARGGLRWSDRREDFRTEVLGLVKAQIVKNSVIVPTGSKGGFVCKKLLPTMNAKERQEEAVSCYKKFISGLLDITDNLVAGQIVKPKNVICYDGDDPYLVVAADKGTATFSDFANQISQSYNFWLGDAFASGGSAGYDHKKIGITAKGAWESTKRHFRHLGVDTQTQPFTVIGIGDLSGDVFGNGMLLSRYIKLIAAFNHQHIFIDPNPDCQISYTERERMFNLPTSTWEDYDKSKISQGGGVYSRSLKSIQLTPEVKQILGVTVDELTPDQLINTLLKSKVDLLYNGGIGTYIKSSQETHEMVKDKANDHVRVNGNELQVKVVVEGGNLGATQLGRIEFAKCGGSIYTDAIDNSAGVDCSDHEVNIKILFADVMQKTSMSVEQRNSILELMTDEVSSLVLRDNYLQTQILRYVARRANELFSIQTNYIDKLEKRGELDRKVEFLPTNEEIAQRQHLGTGLTLPESSVLLAYSKILLDRELVSSELVKSNIFDDLLLSYFPTYLQENYKDNVLNHYLRKEIVATLLSNLVVNHMGITFISRFEDEFRVGAPQIVQAFYAVFQLIDAPGLFAQIEALDGKMHAEVQVDMIIRLKKALERMTRWTLRNIKNSNDIDQIVSLYKYDIQVLIGRLDQIIPLETYSRVLEVEKGCLDGMVPQELSKIISRTNYIPQLLDIAILAKETKHDLLAVAVNYFHLGNELKINWLIRNLIRLPEHNKWQSLSRSALLSDGYALYTFFMQKAINNTLADDSQFGKTWINQNKDKLAQINAIFDELQSYQSFDLAMLSAITREFSRILES